MVAVTKQTILLACVIMAGRHACVGLRPKELALIGAGTAGIAPNVRLSRALPRSNGVLLLALDGNEMLSSSIPIDLRLAWHVCHLI